MAGKKGVPEASEGNQFLGRDLGWHLAFALLLIVTLGFFIAWSMQYINNQQFMVQLLTAIAFGVFMAFNIGGNDVANSFGTSVGAGTLTMKQALVVAAIFEVSGAVLAGGEVTETVRSGIVSLDSVSANPLDFVYIMIASLLGAALWLLIATWRGWPVSTTHSIVGGIVGAALTVGFATNTGGWEMVQWAEIGRIAISWVISPILGGLCSFFLYSFVKKNILVYNEKADTMMKEIKQEKKAYKKSYREAFERMSDIQKVAYTNMMARDAATFAGDDFDEDDLESEYYHELFAIERRLNKIDPHAALEKWVPILASFGAIIIASMLLFKGLKNLHLDISNVGNFLILA
ncbi:MAG: inorganic phosphate transporter, partial [Peptococcus niger]